MSKKLYGDFETVVIRKIAEWTTESFLVEKTTEFALQKLDEQDLQALNRIFLKVHNCSEEIIGSLIEIPEIEEIEEREDEYYD